MWDDPVSALRWMGGEGIEFAGPGRWVGYLAYEALGLFEDIGSGRTPTIPLFAFGYCPDSAPLARAGFAAKCGCESGAGSMTEGEYRAAVARGIGYIEAGDVFQVNLSHKLLRPGARSAGEVFARLCANSPSRYGAALEFEDFALVSNSPELFFRLWPDGRIVTRPIKGTRPRGQGMVEELLGSEKDKAELAMIVDLERNDLGRICRTGTVKVTEARVIETHATVVHGVASVEGKLKSGVGFAEILRAMFPCGSITGAPKIRAMQIIQELEPDARDAYCGAIGFVRKGNGGIEAAFNVAIRTMTLRNGIATIPVGAGIVADSDPAEEWEETLTKSRAMLAAVE
jgi:para-aminobenzoate synthetase component I